VQNPWCVHARLRRLQLFQPNQPQDSGRRDAENDGGFTDRHLAARLAFSLTVDRNRVVAAQRADMLRRPDLSMCCAALILIQDCRDPRVWFDSRQPANDLHNILVGKIPMVATANLLELNLGVISALPMQHEAYSFAIRRSNDLFQRDTKEPFLVLRQTLRIIPEFGEIPCKGQQLPFLRVAECLLRRWPQPAFSHNIPGSSVA
jgi:hypothetical protein